MINIMKKIWVIVLVSVVALTLLLFSVYSLNKVFLGPNNQIQDEGSQAVDKLPPGLPDLIISEIKAEFVNAGGSFNITLDVEGKLKNIGTDKSPSTAQEIRVIFPDGFVWTMGSSLSKTLEPGEEFEFGGQFGARFFTPGEYKIEGVADPEGVIMELNESNNVNFTFAILP